MQFIPKKWYIAYNWTLTSISGLFIFVYALTKLLDPLKTLGVNFNLTLNGSIFALVTVLAGTVGFILISKKLGSWLGAIVTTMAFDMFIITQLANANHKYIFLYIVLWWGIAIYSGAFGPIVTLTSNFISLIICILLSGGSLSTLSPELKIMMIGVVILSVVPYLLFWHKKIQKNQTPATEAPAATSNVESIPDDTKKESETLIESIADGVVVIDRTGKITLFNPTASEMTEWALGDALGMDVNIIVLLANENGEALSPEENPFAMAIKSNTKIETSALLTGHKGRKMIISMVVSPVIVGGSAIGVVAVLRDVTNQRAVEKQRADFISTASHEMRTPVAAIEGYLSLAMNTQVSSIDSKARDFLEKAHQSTQQLGKLFQDLLTTSRAEDGRLVNHPEVIEMSQFIQHLAESFQLAAEKKHLIVDFVVLDENGAVEQTSGKVLTPLYYVHVDPERISEVVTNVFDNALKYTQTGKITIGLGGNAQNVQIYIQDTGAGIPAEDVPHLFQKFYRVDSSAVRTIGGTGLGLYICKKIVELYGGQIWVESELGKGSTFRINLPRLNSQQAESLKRTETAESQVAMPQSNATL